MHTPFMLVRTVSRLLFTAVVGCLYLSSLQAQSMLDDVATAIVVDGQVSKLVNGDQQVALFPRTQGMDLRKYTVAAKDVVITGPDGHAIFQIKDGSTFEVFQNSQVAFRNTFNLEDLVNVILGKIRVSIEHKNGPNNKKVSTPTAIISVRGTVFDVAVEDIDGTTYVSVEEGQVLVQHRMQPGPTKILNQNEAVRVYPNQPLAKAGGPQPNAVKFALDRIANAVQDIVLNNPGGLGVARGSAGPIGQGDKGGKKPTPPVTPPPPPGGGGGQ
jgi:hypothetical protein